jgi:hypothetical protein
VRFELHPRESVARAYDGERRWPDSRFFRALDVFADDGDAA